jgi:autotransporter-associated beta strand protein
LNVDLAEARTGNVNAFATSNGGANLITIRNLTSTEDLHPGMSIMSPGLGDGIQAGTTITRIDSANNVEISLPVGEFAFYNNTPITFGPAPERKLTLSGSNTANNTLASLIGNASDGGLVGLNKNGAGKWIVTGNNTYTGTTNVNEGTLLINGTQTGAGLTTVAAGATLGGTGQVGGALANNGTVNPGASVGTLNVNGNVTMGENSHFAVELQGAAADRLAITGNLDLTALGNSLDVIDLGLSGTSWVIATYTGTLTGTFESITSGYMIDYGALNNSQITLSIVAGVAGDFNDDNVVDAADYVTWRKNQNTNNPLPNDNGLGTPIGTAHYDLWRTHFGQTGGAGSGSAAGGAVPEPASWLLASLALIGCAARSRRPS